MALTKSSIQASLQAAVIDPNTSSEIKEAIDVAFSKFPFLGGITFAQESQKVENFLNANTGSWTVKNFRRVIVFLRTHWDRFPS